MRNIKSVLVYLKNPQKDVYEKPGWNTEHLGICYLGAALRREGFDVILIDGAAEELSSEQVCSKILVLDVEFIGFSITYSTIMDALSIATLIKTERPKTHICFGGHHATLSAQEILEKEKSIDSIVYGDGEITIVQLVKALCAGDSLDGIEGIYYRDNHGIVKNVNRMVISDLDKLPFPIRDTLRISSRKGTPYTASICSSRGCPWSCQFCSTPAYNKLQGEYGWRARSATNVVDEIQFIIEEVGCRHFVFVDDNLVLPNSKSKERLHEIASLIIQRELKITWYMLCSTIALGEGDVKLLELLKQAGLKWTFMGVEAGDQNTLKTFNKYNGLASTERNIKMIDLMALNGILTLCGIILFHPYSTIEEIRENSKFIKQLVDKPSVGMFAPYCQSLKVYPGIGFFKKIKRDGLLLEGEYHLNACTYRYALSSIQVLSDTMQYLLPNVLDTDWLIWDCRQLLWHVSSASRQSEQLIPVTYEVNQKINEINLINFDFFSKAITLAEQAKQPELEEEKISYLSRLKQHEGILRQQYNFLVEEIAQVEAVYNNYIRFHYGRQEFK